MPRHHRQFRYADRDADFKDGTLKGLSLYLQGQNLTDAPFVTINGNERSQVIDYQRYGRRFLAGFNYRF